MKSVYRPRAKLYLQVHSVSLSLSLSLTCVHDMIRSTRMKNLGNKLRFLYGFHVFLSDAPNTIRMRFEFTSRRVPTQPFSQTKVDHMRRLDRAQINEGRDSKILISVKTRGSIQVQLEPFLSHVRFFNNSASIVSTKSFLSFLQTTLSSFFLHTCQRMIECRCLFILDGLFLTFTKK